MSSSLQYCRGYETQNKIMNRIVRHSIIGMVFMLMSGHICQSQDWITSLDAAKRLALVQNKMILMVWEDATLDPFPVIIEDENGKSARINDLFDAPFLSKMIWEYFIPVSVGESMYDQLNVAIRDERTYEYMSKFNDDSIKIMDANGNILNVKPNYDAVLNLTELIRTYYLNTSALQSDLGNYKKERSYATALHLGMKYIDFAIYCHPEVRNEVLKLSDIYLKEAEQLLEIGDLDNTSVLKQKLNFIILKQQLILDKPKRVIRQLNRIESSEVDETNEPLLAFLYLTSYRLLKDETSAKVWRPKVSLVNLEKSQQIININK